MIYSFNNRYITNEINTKLSSTTSLISKINSEGNNHSSTIEEYQNNTSSLVVILTNESGVFTPLSPEYDKYTFIASDGVNQYEILLNDLSIGLNTNDTISGSFKLNGSIYEPYKLVISGDEVINKSFAESGDILELENSSVLEVKKPLNLNYLYSSYKSITTAIDVITKAASSFELKKASIDNLVGYYNDEEHLSLDILYKTNIDEIFVLIVFDMVNTSSVVSLISPYYGYFILFSLIIVLLIALFISRGFTRPVKIIEGEMLKLVNEDYNQSSYSFRNKELSSLQDNLNFVKNKTKERVEEIESQKERVEKLNSELLNENEIRSSFISRLSHELKTPIMVISATTEALRDGIIDKEDINQEYENILDEVEKTNTIIKNIISTYRGSNHELQLNITRFSLEKLIEDTLTPLLSIAQKNELIINKNINAQVYMNADRKLIGEVISNFLTNAFKYTEKGGVVEINLFDNNVNFIFEVKNYGAHISDENLDKIWLPFYRENVNVDKNSTGMGLYLVRKILSTHNIPHDVTNFDKGVKSYFIIEK